MVLTNVTRDVRALAVSEEEKISYFPFFSTEKKFKSELRLSHILDSRIFLNSIMIIHLTIKALQA